MYVRLKPPALQGSYCDTSLRLMYVRLMAAARTESTARLLLFYVQEADVCQNSKTPPINTASYNRSNKRSGKQE